MASTLSPSAIQRIIFLVRNDDRPTCDKKEENPYYSVFQVLRGVNSKWRAIYELYSDIKPPPPLYYLDSLELALVLKGDVNDEDVRAIFAHGQPLVFWGCPRLLVSKIVEAFSALENEPTYLDVTITPLPGFGAMSPSEAWPQIYSTHLPCYACTMVETVEERRHLRQSSHLIPSSLAPADAFAVEKFHVSRKSFRKRLTLEVQYELEQATAGTEQELPSAFQKMTIRLADDTCLAQGKLSDTAGRSSATMLLLPEFSLEVLGFLDRAQIGSSLLANRDLHALTCQLKQRLPLHHLTCAFFRFPERYSDAYWLDICHRQRDVPYTEMRRLRIPSSLGAEHDCAMIRRHLSNSHVADLQAPDAYDFPFAIKMLASLARRNVSVGRMELRAWAQRLSDYRSMDAVFGGMRMGTLYLSCEAQHFVEFIKTADFWRMSTVQGLRELRLTLREQQKEGHKPRRHARSNSALWVSGIHLLRNCQRYRVDYRTRRHLRSIERKIVQICEEFERGNIERTVKHFDLWPTASTKMNFAFSRDNLLVAGTKVEGKNRWDRINDFSWDVYRFRNACTGGYLTACVGRNTSLNSTESVLHLMEGEVLPDASFAGY